MRLNSTSIAVAAVSSLVTMVVTVLITVGVTNSFRHQELSDVQRGEIARLVDVQLREQSDSLTKATREQGLSEAQRAEVVRVVTEHFHSNPESMQEILAEIVKRRIPTAPMANSNPNPDRSAVIKTNAQALFASAHQVTIGNPQGDVTLVEFFDYNCGYCKRALADTLELLKNDSKLKIVLKELPVLGPGSLEAAKVAIAVRMHDPDGTKYLEFHEKMLAGGMSANKVNALAVAQSIGLDVVRLEIDMASDEVTTTLDESRKLAQTLGINGTPSYVVGNKVVIGAVGLAALSDTIKSARN